jgi:hypothetical protein
MTIYYLGVALEAVNYKALPTLREHVDNDFLRKARSTFQQSFPGHVQARHTVEHAVEQNVNKYMFDKAIYAWSTRQPLFQLMEEPASIR